MNTHATDEMFTMGIIKHPTTQNGQYITHKLLTVNHQELGNIIKHHCKKFSSFAKKKALDYEDLNAFSISILLEFVDIMEIELTPTIELTRSQYAYFHTMLGRQLRDYANDDERKRTTEADGTRSTIYEKIETTNMDNYEPEATRPQTPQNTSHYNELSELFEDARHNYLTATQNEVIDAFIRNDGNITQTASHLGRKRQSISRTLNVVIEKLRKLIGDDNHTRIYEQKLDELHSIITLFISIDEKGEMDRIDTINQYIAKNIETDMLTEYINDHLELFTLKPFKYIDEADEFILFLIHRIRKIQDYKYKERGHGICTIKNP